MLDYDLISPEVPAPRPTHTVHVRKSGEYRNTAFLRDTGQFIPQFPAGSAHFSTDSPIDTGDDKLFVTCNPIGPDIQSVRATNTLSADERFHLVTKTEYQLESNDCAPFTELVAVTFTPEDTNLPPEVKVYSVKLGEKKRTNLALLNPYGEGRRGTYKADLPSVEFERDEDTDDGNWQPMTGQLAKALPGHRINIRINADKLPVGVVLTDYEWILPSKTFKDYEADQTHSKLSLVEASDRKNTEVHFYFADSGSKELKVRCKVNGQSAEFSTSIMVEKPTATFTTKLGATAFNGDRSSLGLYAAGGTTFGIEFTGKVSVPATRPAGEWNWVQLITPNRNKVETDGRLIHHTLNGQSVLDSTYPYEPGPVGSHPGSATGYLTGGQRTNSDTPDSSLIGYKSFTVSDSYTMYLMFLPNGAASRYVPLLSVSWSWGGIAHAVSHVWSLTTPHQSASEAAETSLHPTWTKNVKPDRYEP